MGFSSSPMGLCESIGKSQVLNVGCHYHGDSLRGSSVSMPVSPAHTLACAHTLLFAPNLFTAREVPLKSNLSPSCYKLAPIILGMERPGPSKELLLLQKNSTLRTRGPRGQMGLHLRVKHALLCYLISNPSSTRNRVYNLGKDLTSPSLGCLHC